MFKRSLKYKNKITEVNGIRFHSKKEAERYGNLLWLEKAKEITKLELQVRVPLRVNDILICTYIVDFKYIEKGKVVVEDVKGFKTDVFKLKAKLFMALNPDVELRLT